jgi:hypothetical protein
MAKIYRVGDLRKVIKESANEFKPVVGNKDNKKINGEAYKSVSNSTKDYDGGLGRAKGVAVTPDMNQGMSDIRYDKTSDEFKKRTQSQLKGYPSKQAEDLHKNDEFGNAIFDNDIKRFKDHAKDSKKIKDTIKLQGLTGRTLSMKDVEDDNETMFESKRIDKLNFKNTKFLSEGHMLSKVPDELKVEGKRFIMKDTADNEYLVEWSNKEPKVTKKVNMTLVNEQKNRIKELWGYKSPESSHSTSSFRVQENKGFTDMVNRARKLMD